MKTRFIVAGMLLAAPVFATASDWTQAGVSAIKHIAEDKILVDITDTPPNQPNCVGGVYEFIVTDPAQIRLITGLADRRPLWFKGDGTCVGSNERLQHVGFDDSAPL